MSYNPKSTKIPWLDPKTAWLNDPVWRVNGQLRRDPVGTIQISSPPIGRMAQQSYYDAFQKLMKGFYEDFLNSPGKVAPVYPEIEALHELLDVLGIDRSSLA